MAPGKRLAVFSIREKHGGSYWMRAGTAFVNKDGSLNVMLDVLPIDGKLHVREAAERKDAAADTRAYAAGGSALAGTAEPSMAAASAGGH